MNSARLPAKRLALVLSILLAAVAGSLWPDRAPRLPPLLVFRGYEGTANSGYLVAKFELRNTTAQDLWLRYASVSDSPLKPPTLEQPVADSPRTPDAARKLPPSSVARFEAGVKLPPGIRLPLEFPLHRGDPAKRVGVAYYLGTFSSTNAFLSSFQTPNPGGRASWIQQGLAYCQRLKKRPRAPDYREVWSAESVSFPAGLTNSPP